MVAARKNVILTVLENDGLGIKFYVLTFDELKTEDVEIRAEPAPGGVLLAWPDRSCGFLPIDDSPESLEGVIWVLQCAAKKFAIAIAENEGGQPRLWEYLCMPEVEEKLKSASTHSRPFLAENPSPEVWN